jgi:glycosyltransferase involved in cell wall biosynthesis
MKPCILYIVPATYEALITKGVDHMIFERDEGGFFGKVITVHPFCPKTQTITLNKCHQVIEVGFDLVPGAMHWRFLLYLQSPIHFFRVLWKIIRLIKKNRIDLIRANDPFWMGLFSYIASRTCNIPFCVSIHADYEKRMELDKKISMPTLFGSYKLGKRLERFIFSKASRVLPIRETLKSKAAANGASPDKIRVIPHGIDLSIYDHPPTNNIFQRFEINPGIKIISFVGRLAQENYIDDVLETARRLGQKRKDFIIVMAGGGKEEKRIKTELVANPLLNDYILLVGFQPREVCIDLRRASKASLCLMAGFSLIEACAAGHPVVSYDIEWHSELVKNKETGFLVKEREIDGVVEALDWILAHPEESDLMGQKARTLTFKRHELKKTSAIKVKWYSELLRKGNDGN